MVLGTVAFLGKAGFLVFLVCVAGTIFVVVVHIVISYAVLTMAAGAVWRRIKRVCRFSV